MAYPLATPGGVPTNESTLGRTPCKTERAEPKYRSYLAALNDEKSASVNSGRCVSRRDTGYVELAVRTVTVAGTTICRMELAAKNKNTTRT
jgi:hypothetical protein